MDSICFGPSGVKCSGSLFPYRRGSPNIPGRNGSNMTVTEECSAYFPYTVTIRGLPEHGNARLLKMCLTGPVHSHPCPLLSGSAYKYRESQGPGGGPDAALCCFLWHEQRIRGPMWALATTRRLTCRSRVQSLAGGSALPVGKAPASLLLPRAGLSCVCSHQAQKVDDRGTRKHSPALSATVPGCWQGP